MNLFKSFSKRHSITAYLLLTIFLLFITLAVVRALLPSALKSYAQDWFETQNIQLEMGEIDLALFEGSIAINDITGKSKNGKKFSAHRVKVSWQWRPLLENTAFIDTVEISGLKGNVTFYDNNDLDIAGILIKQKDEKDTKAAAKEKTVSETTAATTDWNTTVENILLSNANLCMQKLDKSSKPVLDYCLSLKKLNWKGNINYTSSIKSMTPETIPLYINGALKVSGVNIKNNQLKLALLDINDIDLKNIIIQTPHDIAIKSIAVNKLVALERIAVTKEQPQTIESQLLAFDKLSIAPLSFLKLSDLKVGDIQLEGSQVYFEIDKDKTTEIHKRLAKFADGKKPEVKDKAENTATKPFNFSFDSLEFKTDKHLVYRDNSLKEPFATDVHEIEFKLGKLDSRSADTKTQASLSLKIDKHASLEVNAEITPLAERPSMEGTGKITGLDLRMLDTYSRQHIGHNIKSGQLDAEIKMQIIKGKIDSKMALTLRHLNLEAISKKDAEELNSEFGYPVNSALSLLRDRDNTIRLEIPVNGDTNNPEFDPNDAFKKASSKAITSAVISYYSPFGLVLAAEALFNLATAINFEPVIFEPKIATLTASHTAQLNKLASLMTERPNIHLTLCGYSNKADLDSLYPGASNNIRYDDEITSDEELINKQQLEDMKKIATSRSAALKDFLVKEKSVNASRLVECRPEFKLNGISGVKISI